MDHHHGLRDIPSDIKSVVSILACRFDGSTDGHCYPASRGTVHWPVLTATVRQTPDDYAATMWLSLLAR